MQNINELPELQETVALPKGKRAKAIYLAIGAGFALGLLISLFIIIFAFTSREWGYYLFPAKITSKNHTLVTPGQYRKALRQTERNVMGLRRRIKRLTPIEPYLIVDTSDNLIFLKAGDRVLHQGICSTGSYTLLKTADEKEQWIFKTPRGMLRVQNKIVDPVWRMPDWAFIEDGKPVPAPYSSERYEPGVLGDYALDIGDGYLIHGTLYQRFLGLPVTHGCVRLGDKELRAVYRSLNVGSKVFIY